MWLYSSTQFPISSKRYTLSGAEDIWQLLETSATPCALATLILQLTDWLWTFGCPAVLRIRILTFLKVWMNGLKRNDHSSSSPDPKATIPLTEEKLGPRQVGQLDYWTWQTEGTLHWIARQWRDSFCTLDQFVRKAEHTRLADGLTKPASLTSESHTQAATT